MTVSSSTRKAGPFLGNDVATSFPFEFKVFTTADIELTLTGADGTQTVLVLDSDYSIALNADQDNDPGGTITYPLSGDPLATGDTLVGLDTTAVEQGSDITNLGRFLPQVFEDAFDKLTILLQQFLERLGRAITVPATDTGVSLTLPRASERAGGVLAFDNDGGVIIGPPLGDFQMELDEAAAQAAIATAQATIATTKAGESSTSAALSQDWSTKTDGEVVVGEGYGAKKYSQDASTEAGQAAVERALAEVARDAAFGNANVYDDVATGLAAVSSGEQFMVVEGDEIVRYEDNAGVAEEKARFPTAAVVSAIRVLVGNTIARTAQLFDKDAATLEYRLDPTNGTLIGLAQAWTSDFIPVSVGEDYTFTYPYYLVWYDAAKAFLSGTTTATNPMTAPASAAFMRVTGRTNLGHDIDLMMVAQASTGQPWEPYGGFLLPDLLRGSWDIRDASPFTLRDDNLFDVGASGVQDGHYQSKSGTIAASATYFLSDYIPVTPGVTYSFGNGERGARFICAFDATRTADSSAGSDVQVTTWTCPAGIAEIRVSTWSTAALGGVVKVQEGATLTALEPWGYDLGDTFLPWMASLEATEGLARMRHAALFRSKREAGVSARLSIAAIGDSYTDAYDRWTNKTMTRLVATYGDGGGGWTGYGFNSGAGPFVLAGTQPGGLHGNVRPTSYTLKFDGAWAGPANFTGSPGPDLAFVQSATAGALIQRAVPATPTHTALKVVFIGTADGVVQYRVDSGSWTNVNVQGTVGNIGSFDIALTAGAHTAEIAVVSGTVKLCGDISVSAADGVVFHKLGVSGSRIEQWATPDATQQIAAWDLLDPDVAIIMDGTNSQGNGTAGNYVNWKTYLGTVIDRLRSAAAFPDILLVAPPENQLGRVNPMADFEMQMRFLARTKNTAFLALQQSFGVLAADYASTSGFPLFASDNTHPSTTAGGYIMDLAIRRAVGLA